MRVAVVVLLIIAGLCGPVCAETRVALIIGMGKYQRVPPLANPPRDAAAIAEKLKNLGFQVTTLINADFDTLRESVRRFGDRASRADVAVLYYAGHGLQVDHENYIIPVDAKLDRGERDLPYETLSLSLILPEVASAKKLGLLILDACRNDPFTGKMQSSTLRRGHGPVGLARVDNIPPNTAVAMATRADTVAEDGSGDHSPFTAAILKNLDVPGLELSYFFRTVRDMVLKATNYRQEPYFFSSLGSDPFYFLPPKLTADTVDANSPDLAKLLGPYVEKALEATLAQRARANTRLAQEATDASTAEQRAQQQADWRKRDQEIAEAQRRAAEETKAAEEARAAAAQDKAAREAADAARSKAEAELADAIKRERQAIAQAKQAQDKANRLAVQAAKKAADRQQAEEERQAAEAAQRDAEARKALAEQQQAEQPRQNAEAAQQEAAAQAALAAKKEAERKRKEAEAKLEAERQQKEAAAKAAMAMKQEAERRQKEAAAKAALAAKQEAERRQRDADAKATAALEAAQEAEYEKKEAEAEMALAAHQDATRKQRNADTKGASLTVPAPFTSAPLSVLAAREAERERRQQEANAAAVGLSGSDAPPSDGNGPFLSTPLSALAAQQAERERKEAAAPATTLASPDDPLIEENKAFEVAALPRAAPAVKATPTHSVPAHSKVGAERVYGAWCGDGVKFELSPRRWIYNLPQGDASYVIKAYSSSGDIVTVRWQVGSRVWVSELRVTATGLLDMRAHVDGSENWFIHNRPMIHCAPGSVAE